MIKLVISRDETFEERMITFFSVVNGLPLSSHDMRLVVKPNSIVFGQSCFFACTDRKALVPRQLS